MADFNAIGRPQLATGIGRLYGVDMPRVSVIGSEIQLTTSPWERPEFWALLGGSLGWGLASLDALAGNASHVQLLNPAQSGVLLIVEKVWLNNDAGSATYITLAIDSSTVLTTSTGGWVNRDLRRANTTGGSGSLAGRIRTQHGVVAITGSVIAQVLQAAFTTAVYDLDLVLPPGWSVRVFLGPSSAPIVNQQIRCTFIGRERAAPQTELTNL
jgi:hypothetical protein